MMVKDSAILQGAFSLANRLCQPSSLSSLQKEDWFRVGQPVVEAVKEICRQEEIDSHSNTTSGSWKKKIVCVVWLKLLSREAGEDVETEWRENPFFPLLNGLPDVNDVVLLELVKSTAATDIFAHFLLHLPQFQTCIELERLTHYVTSIPLREEDVRLFMEVCWELWKGREEQEAGEDNSLEALFANQFARLSSSSHTPQAAKRLKLDTSNQSASSAPADVLHIFFYALKDMRDHILSTDLCLLALSISLDLLYTSFLIDQEVMLPTKEKLSMLSKDVSIRKSNNEKLSPELIRQAQRDLHAYYTPSQFQLSRMKLGEALKIVTDLSQFWLNSGLLKAYDDLSPNYSNFFAFKLHQSVQRVLIALDKAESPAREMETNILRGLLELLAFPNIDTSPEVNLEITTIIISHRLGDYQSFAALFASEMSWAACDELWLDCLQKNQAAFQQHDILLNLVTTLLSKLHSGSSDMRQCRKLMKVTADLFSALSLEDKNKSLAAMVTLSSRGFLGGSVPSAVTDGFEQELNMAFNCIIQGGGGTSQGSLNTAASLVARVAFQNPEAALKSCCHSAIFNKGAFSLMAKILQLLPGLRGHTGIRDEAQSNEGREDADDNWKYSGSSLFSRCLQEVIKTKSWSANEKEQFLKFLGLLMMPVITDEGGKTSFLSPQEVVNIFVLPNLSSTGHSFFDIELSVQLLHTALCADVHESSLSPHWVLDCSPFPLLYILAQLHDQALRCWEEPAESAVYSWSMETKELLVSALTTLGQLVGAEVAATPSSWSRALFWLYNKTEELDWTVRFHLKPLWREHFKNEVPSSLLTVCELPEQQWSGLDLPQYGPGTGLLAWMECCAISDALQCTMLSCLSLDRRRADHIGMFSKGLLVALTQILPWCSICQWSRLLGALRELITSGRLHVPFSLEYVEYLPLLDLRRFSCELRLSVLLLRVLQFLCGSSCSHWLSAEGWAHVGRLYSHAVRDMMNSLRAKMPLPVSASITPKKRETNNSNPSNSSVKVSKMFGGSPPRLEDSPLEEETGIVPSQEVLFVLSQLFCHVQHIQVMMPGGQCEPLFLSSLEILSHYEAILSAFPDSSSPLERDNTRHFFSTITDNLENAEMKAVLQQKIAQLVSAAA